MIAFLTQWREGNRKWINQNVFDEDGLQRRARGGASLALLLQQTIKPTPGRVPHVRRGVHGPKRAGRSPFQCHCYTGKKIAVVSKIFLARGVKAFEKTVFGPGTLMRTWGTRPGV
jgi:hypothetical protein